jgi:hypothetical protein
VLGFVPLAGAGRQVADHDVEAEFVGELLQFAFPQPDPLAVAAPGLRRPSPAQAWRCQQPGGIGVTHPPEVEPPPADAVHREACPSQRTKGPCHGRRRHSPIRHSRPDHRRHRASLV